VYFSYFIILIHLFTYFENSLSINYLSKSTDISLNDFPLIIGEIPHMVNFGLGDILGDYSKMGDSMSSDIFEDLETINYYCSDN